LGALSPTLNLLWSELAVMERLFPRLPDLPVYRAELQEITAASNNLLFQIVEDMSFTYSDGARVSWRAVSVRPKCQDFLDRVVDARNGFVARSQDIMGKTCAGAPSRS
jgi:anaerobic magnesium-protoporphyrin IX monomethyl ester cyclase